MKLTATLFCHGGKPIQWLNKPLYNGHLTVTAAATKACPTENRQGEWAPWINIIIIINCQNNLLITASFFSDRWKAMKFGWYDMLMINGGIRNVTGHERA